MSDAMRAHIHDRTLEMIRDVGLVWSHDLSLQMLQKRGLQVDLSRRTVRMAPAQVEAMLESAPRDISLYTRPQIERLDYKQGPFLMAAGTIPAIVDLESGARRPATTGDVVRLSTIQDALPNLDLARPIVIARGVPPRHSSLFEYALTLCNTTKHVHHRILAPEDVELLAEVVDEIKTILARRADEDVVARAFASG